MTGFAGVCHDAPVIAECDKCQLAEVSVLPSLFKLPGPLLLIDFETTGCNPNLYDICEFGAAVVTEKLVMVEKAEGVVRPLSGMRDPEAMKIHGFTEQMLSHGLHVSDMLDKLEGMAETCLDTSKMVLAGWGVDFDEKFLKAAYDKLGRKYPFGYRKFDVKPVAIFELALRGHAEGWGHLDRCLAGFGMKFEGDQHTAMCDVWNTWRILRRCAGVA